MHAFNRNGHCLTVDNVIWWEGYRDKGDFEVWETYVLMIRRANEPYKGFLALPGGFVEENELLADAAVRELREETGLVIQANALEQVGVYDALDRDPRGRTIGVAFLYVDDVSPELPPVKGGDDAAEALWCSLDTVRSEPVAFDHRQIIDDALDWI